MNNNQNNREDTQLLVEAITSFVRARKKDYSRKGAGFNHLFRATELNGNIYFALLSSKGVSTTLLEKTMSLDELEEALALVIIQEYLAEFQDMLSQLYMNSSNSNKVRALISEFREKLNKELI